MLIFIQKEEEIIYNDYLCVFLLSGNFEKINSKLLVVMFEFSFMNSEDFVYIGDVGFQVFGLIFVYDFYFI